jgi:cytochrome c556
MRASFFAVNDNPQQEAICLTTLDPPVITHDPLKSKETSMKRYVFAVALTAGLSGVGQAQFQKPEDAIKYRQAAFTLMGNHFGRIAAMAQGKVPFDAKAAQANADVLSTVVNLPYTAFGDGTDLGTTKAKPEIWKEMPKFKEAAEKMQSEVVKLNAATKTGNLDAIKAAVGDVGKSCKACHDNYREK